MGLSQSLGEKSDKRGGGSAFCGWRLTDAVRKGGAEPMRFPCIYNCQNAEKPPRL